MREWIQTGVVVVGMAVVVVCAVFGFLMIQATNQTLLSNLAQLKPQEVTLATLKVNVRRGSADGPVITGKHIELVGNIFNDMEQRTIGETLDASGEAIFGPVRPGEYYLQFADSETKMSTRSEITLFAGEKEEAIIVPENKPVQVELRAEMPPSSDDAHQLISVDVSWTNDYMGRPWSRSTNLLLGATGMWEYEIIDHPERVPADAWGRPLGDRYKVYRRAENPAVLDVIAQDISVQVTGRVLTSGLPDSNPRDYLGNLPSEFFPYVVSLDQMRKTSEGQTTSIQLEGQNTFEVPLEPSLEQSVALEPRVCKLLECSSPAEPRLATVLAFLSEHTSCPEVFPVPDVGQSWIWGNQVTGVHADKVLTVTSYPSGASGDWRSCGLLSVPEQLRNGLAGKHTRCLLALYEKSERPIEPAPMVLPLKAPWDAIAKQANGVYLIDGTAGSEAHDIFETPAVRAMTVVPYALQWYVFDLTGMLSKASPENPMESLLITIEEQESKEIYQFVSTRLSDQNAGSVDDQARFRPAFYVFPESATQAEPAAH